MKPKLSDGYLALMREQSEEEFVKNTLSSDLWILLAGLLNYPIVINTGVYGSSQGYVIGSEDDLKSFVSMLLHPEQDEDEELNDEE
jgi:hypothetical protein